MLSQMSNLAKKVKFSSESCILLDVVTLFSSSLQFHYASVVPCHHIIAVTLATMNLKFAESDSIRCNLHSSC